MNSIILTLWIPTHVKKKAWTRRIVHDYRRLNEFTVWDVTPSPHPRSILEELGVGWNMQGPL